MTELIRCCLLFLILRRVSSGDIADTSKYGCIGGSTELYQSIPFNSPEVIISLYKNGEHNEMIAMWTMVKSVFNETFKNGYSDKLFYDKYGNIWIRNLGIYDDGKYTLQIILPSWTSKREVQLFVLVAPATHCKPKIIRSENTLIASLEMNDCGKPSPTVFWLEHSGISYGKNVIKLQTGNEAGTYHACIEGPALKCAQSSKLSDFCEVLRVDENKIRSPVLGVTSMTHTSAVNLSLLELTETTKGSAIHSTFSESSGITTGTLAAITCVSIAILVGMFITGIVILFRRMKKMERKLTKQDTKEMERKLTKQDTKEMERKLTKQDTKEKERLTDRYDEVYEDVLRTENDQPESYTLPDTGEKAASAQDKPYRHVVLDKVNNGLEIQLTKADVNG